MARLRVLLAVPETPDLASRASMAMSAMTTGGGTDPTSVTLPADFELDERFDPLSQVLGYPKKRSKSSEMPDLLLSLTWDNQELLTGEKAAKSWEKASSQCSRR